MGSFEKAGLKGLLTTSTNPTHMLENLPKVERRGFDVEAKIFKQVQKEFNEALSKKRGGALFDIKDKKRGGVALSSLSPLLPLGGGTAGTKEAAKSGGVLGLKA